MSDDMNIELDPEDAKRTVDKLLPPVFNEIYPHLIPLGVTVIVKCHDTTDNLETTVTVRSVGMSIIEEFGMHHLRAAELKRAWMATGYEGDEDE